jgi:hypothetical protein
VARLGEAEYTDLVIINQYFHELRRYFDDILGETRCGSQGHNGK